MTVLSLVAALLALLWGLIWSLLLQFTAWGRFLALKRAWITVVIGIGVDLAILVIVLPMDEWLEVLVVVAASAVPIVTRSVINELVEMEAALEAIARKD